MFAKKRAVTLMLSILVLLLVAMTACSKAKEQTQNSPAGGSSTPASASKGALQFSYTLWDKHANWMKDLKWVPVMLDKTNTKIDVQNGGEGDQYYKNVDLKVGSKQFTDAGIVNVSQAEVYGSQGAFLDLKSLIDENAPNIKKYIEANPEYKSLISNDKGQIFGLIWEYPTITAVTFYRADLFEKASITEMPKTIEEFTNVLRKLKETFKDNKNFYPFSGRDGYIKFQEVFDAQDKIENGKVSGIYDLSRGTNLHAPGLKSLIEWYITMYNEGLIDPEWVNGIATEESWQTKMLTGNSAISNDFFTRPSWFMNNGGPTNDPKFTIKVMDPLFDSKGSQPKVPPYEPKYRTDMDFVINAQAKDKAKDIIKFLDYAYSEEGQTLQHLGVKGESYKDDGGKKEYTVKFDDQGNKPLGTPVWNFLQDRLTFPSPVDNGTYYQWMDDLTKSFATTYFDKFALNTPVLKYSTEQLMERSQLLAKVKPTYEANLVKFITGKRAMSEWDAFAQEMAALGYDRITEIDQAAYDALQ